MDKTERKIAIYSAIIITVMLNSGKLMALRNDSLMAHFWTFNLAEYTFQIAAQWLFCYLLFYLNLGSGWLARQRGRGFTFIYVLCNMAFFLVCLVFLGGLQRRIFGIEELRGFYWLTYFARFALAIFLVGVLIHILLLMRESKKHVNEKAALKTAYATAELELLKEQLNPHFLFNSLSTLSGVVREDPALAQQYIGHLSKVFRYTLVQPLQNLVMVEQELTMLQSFAQLIYMRFEDAFILKIEENAQAGSARLPHLSLQPLLENAAKHNAATLEKPLLVEIFFEKGYIVVRNNVVPVIAESNGIGLFNLNERFKIMTGREIEIESNSQYFFVKLPLVYV